MKKYEFLEHTAELKIKTYGKNLNEIFENTALAFCEIIGRGKKVKNKIEKKSIIEHGNNESLLYMFIDEMIYLLDAENFLVSKCKTKLESECLKTTFYGDKATNYKNLDHVKAATFHDIYVKQKRDKTWEAQVVVDV